MATKKENQDLSDLKSEVMEHSFILKKQVLPAIEKMEKTLEDNMSGIQLATLLNSKIIAVVLGGIVMGAIFFIAKSGGLE